MVMQTTPSSVMYHDVEACLNTKLLGFEYVEDKVILSEVEQWYPYTNSKLWLKNILNNFSFGHQVSFLEKH